MKVTKFALLVESFKFLGRILKSAATRKTCLEVWLYEPVDISQLYLKCKLLILRIKKLTVKHTGNAALLSSLAEQPAVLSSFEEGWSFYF